MSPRCFLCPARAGCNCSFSEAVEEALRPLDERFEQLIDVFADTG